MPLSLSNNELDILIGALERCVGPSGMDNALSVIYRKMVRAKKRITVQSAKDKGRNLQYWVCGRIADILHITFNQSDDLCPIHSREMGQTGSDIVFRTMEVQKAFPFSIECKSTENFELVKTVKQAKDNQRDGTDWLIVHKRKAFTEPIVIMEWSAFEKLIVKEER